MAQSPPPAIARDRSTELAKPDLAECGWRITEVCQPDGTIAYVNIPLTESEFLHPQEGYHLPNSTFHDTVAGDARAILTCRYANDPTVGVFRDLLIEWDNPAIGDHCPDTFVAFGIQNKDQNRHKFIVANEGVRPALILEVVSPKYRKADRETKVRQYAQVGVQEYVIIDGWTDRPAMRPEVLGYRLVADAYQPIPPDEAGRIWCETVGVWISLQEMHLVIEDGQTGERLKAALELAAENRELTEENQVLARAKAEAEQRAAEMAALLARYQQQFGDLPGG